jgi:hypothetical protein
MRVLNPDKAPVEDAMTYNELLALFNHIHTNLQNNPRLCVLALLYLCLGMLMVWDLSRVPDRWRDW